MDTMAYSVETLARRWDCTGAHVRNIIKSGKLKAFKIGKLTRISASQVAAFEQGNEEQPCQTSSCSASTVSSTSSGMMKQESAVALRSARQIARRQTLPSPRSNVVSMPPRPEPRQT